MFDWFSLLFLRFSPHSLPSGFSTRSQAECQAGKILCLVAGLRTSDFGNFGGHDEDISFLSSLPI